MPPASPAPLDGVQQEHLRGNAVSGKKKKGEGKKLAAFGRVWSSADEVRILECLAEHVKANGGGPLPGAAKLRAMLAGRVLDKAEFTGSQIYEKVRRLREQYGKLRSTGGGGGDEDEDIRMFELSEAIWGDLAGPAPTQPLQRAKKIGTSDAAPADTRVHRGLQELRRLYPNLAAAVDRIAAPDHDDTTAAVLKRAFEFIDDVKAGELDATIKEQRVLEVKTMRNRDAIRSQVRRTLIRYVD